MDVIGRQVGQLSKLIDDLMDASRVRLGKIELRRDRLDLTGVLQRAIDAVLPDADARHQRLVTHLPAAGAICVMGGFLALVPYVFVVSIFSIILRSFFNAIF